MKYSFKKGGSGLWPTLEFLAKLRNFGRDNDVHYQHHLVGVASELSVAIAKNCMPDLQTYRKSGDGGIDLVIRTKENKLVLSQVKALQEGDKMFLLSSLNDVAQSPCSIFIAVRVCEIIDDANKLRGLTCEILGFISKEEFLLKKQIDIFKKEEKPFVSLENLTPISEL